MKAAKLLFIGFFAVCLSISIISCKNETVNLGSAEKQIREMEQLQVQGILDQDSTIIKKYYRVI